MINEGQWLIFLAFFWTGNVVGILYYLSHYNMFRKKDNKYLNIIEDIVFCLLLIPLVWGALLVFNYGKTDFYCFIAVFFGSILSYSILSSVLDKVKQMIYNFFTKTILLYFTKLSVIIKKKVKQLNRRKGKNGRGKV